MALSHNAMAFRHQDGFIASWKQARRFIQPHGRMATMPDIVDARLAAGVNDFEWNAYFTTTSAEYFGYSSGGVRILIVAHGVGPMATLDGIARAYSFEYKDKTRSKQGGRISMREFRALESGSYGPVSIVEFDPILKRRAYPFGTYFTAREATHEPLVQARLGPKAHDYLVHHDHMARRYHLEEEHATGTRDPFIVKMEDPGNCAYSIGGFQPGWPISYPYLDKGDGALAHLIATGGLFHVSHDGARGYPSLANDVGCYGWWNGARLCGIRAGGEVGRIHPGFGSIHRLILERWVELMEPCEPQRLPRLSALMRFGNALFTQYRKSGARMDTHEPEYVVLTAKRVGGLVDFTTEIGGHPVFFKYDLAEVEAIAPPEANAYEFVGEKEIVKANGNPEKHRASIQFYRIEADVSHRIVREEHIKNDYDLLMSLTDEAA